MKGIDWKRKLSSRKFWTAVTGFVVAILFAFNIADMTVEKVTSIISATAILIAYILAEGFVDGKQEQDKEE
ncbi:hypothetical protein VBH15_09415 [Vagococcus fluvialis]|uniref:hypothetical protein n=1 Tax=Vagococcus fluvialis TaxID=2738 RepID=UPI0037D183E0